MVNKKGRKIIAAVREENAKRHRVSFFWYVENKKRRAIRQEQKLLPSFCSFSFLLSLLFLLPLTLSPTVFLFSKRIIHRTDAITEDAVRNRSHVKWHLKYCRELSKPSRLTASHYLLLPPPNLHYHSSWNTWRRFAIETDPQNIEDSMIFCLTIEFGTHIKRTFTKQ